MSSLFFITRKQLVTALKTLFVFRKKESHTVSKNHEGEHMTTKFTFLVNYALLAYLIKPH